MAERQRQEARAELEQEIAILMTLKDAIAGGDDLAALRWAWNHATTSESFGRLDVGKLHEVAGPELTACFRAGLKACWRGKDVPLPKPNGIPAVAVLGLTGLTLDFQEGLTAASLTPLEGELAARYGLHEINGFPAWFEDLRAAHPAAVRSTLTQAVADEWQSTHPLAGVIGRASYTTPELAALIGDAVFDQMDTPLVESGRVQVIANALLWCRSPTDQVVAAVRKQAVTSEAKSPREQAAWTRTWGHIDPRDCGAWLEELGAEAPQRFADVMVEAAALLEDDFEIRDLASRSALMTPEALELWIPLLFRAVRPEDDLHRKGGFTPTSRDEAQRFRGRCTRALALNPSARGAKTLRTLRARPDLAQYQAWFVRLSESQLGVAAEAVTSAWTESDVCAVERGDERRPKTVQELHLLVQRHLEKLRRLAIDDDFSYPGLFRPETPERDLQRWVASNLVLIGRGLYSIDREGALRDEKRADITARVPGVGRLPVELKPAGGKTLKDLMAAVSEQLYALYMVPQEVTHGVLVVLRNRSTQVWRVDGELVDFEKVIVTLRAFAADYGRSRGKVITVTAIDLVGPRGQRAPESDDQRE
jgi:hypothetical protein